MNCQDYQDMLSAYIDRELSHEDQKEVAIHLESCPSCQGDMRSLLAIKEKVRGMHLPSMPADLISRIEAQTLFRESAWEKRLLWGIPMFAAAAALGIWVLLSMRASVVPHTPPNIPLAQMLRRQQELANHPQVAWRTASDTDTTKDLQ